MSVQIEEQGVIRVCGEIDLSNVQDLRDALDQEIRKLPKVLIIDLSETEYIDSAGIAAIMWAYQHICKDGKLALVLTNENIKSIFSLIHADQLPGVIFCDNRACAEE